MKTFIKYDGSEESINEIKALVDKVNKKYEGTHKYSMCKTIDHIWLLSTNLEDMEDNDPNETSVGVTIGYYVYFDIPENVPSYSIDFPSFGCCVEKYYLEYKIKMEL
jgi:hypothetical protein